MFKLLSLTFLALYTTITASGLGGYHYEKPSVSLGVFPTGSSGGHNFGPLSTVAPLPPVPALPPLPTGPSQSNYQTLPVAINSIPKAYLPVFGSDIGKIAQQYQPPSGLTAPSPPGSSPPAPFSFSSQLGSGIGSNLPYPASGAAQPLHIPGGKQAIIHYPPTASAEQDIYESNGRQLRQYSVIEIIDNDIEENSQPFLATPFFDSYRAHIGASGTGAAPAPLSGDVGGLIESRTNVFQQHRSSSQSSTSSVALGSGGLGFVRLPNGNIYLGSGSLGYISGQQHTKNVNEARTRSGATQPDAVHFGHGPLGAQKFNRFVYRFK